MKHIVTTRDNVQFVVDSYPKTIAFDQGYAAARTAAQLASHSDFVRIEAWSGLTGPLEPQAPTPAERRAAFRLIQGGAS